MAGNLVACPKCGQQNDDDSVTCSKCGIELAWAVEHWDKVISGPPDHDAPVILHVDDEVSQLAITGLMLTRAGYRFAKALDGYEGLDLAPRVIPDLIITGLMMPSMYGIDLIRHLKASPTLQNIPVMVLSARGRETIEESIEAGAVKYLTKPVSLQELIGAVRAFVRAWPVVQFIHDGKPDDIRKGIFAALMEKHLCTLGSNLKFGIYQVKDLHPNVIFLPFHLAEVEGLDLLAQLKSDPDISAIPVVMLADRKARKREQRALELGAYAVYTGPLDADKLIAMLPPLPAQE